MIFFLLLSQLEIFENKTVGKEIIVKGKRVGHISTFSYIIIPVLKMFCRIENCLYPNLYIPIAS